MLYYTHCYIADAPLLDLFLSRIRVLDPDAHIIIANDPKAPVPACRLPKVDWLEVVTPNYPLGGNLNGQAMIDGMLTALITAMEQHGQRHIVKIDSDAWLNSVAWLRPGFFQQEDGTTKPEPDYVGLENWTPVSAAGDCYRISICGAQAALKGLRGRKWSPYVKMPEDLIILQLVLRAQLPVVTVPYIEGRHVGMHDSIPGKRELDAWLVHCGDGCRDGSRAPRDFVLLRMRLLAALRPSPTTEEASVVAKNATTTPQP